MAKELRGLPGGPNEYITHPDQLFSIEGYKRNSPDVNNPYNIIPSGRITMQDVDFPVMGVDNYGNQQLMHPGKEYEFPGDQVFEIPMAQKGGQRKPIVVTDKNDPRLKAYNDSLRLYNQELPTNKVFDNFANKNNIKVWQEKDYTKSKNIPKTKGFYWPEHTNTMVLTKDNKLAKVPEAVISKLKNRQQTTVYKNPVQPIVYQKHEEEVKSTKTEPIIDNFIKPFDAAEYEKDIRKYFGHDPEKLQKHLEVLKNIDTPTSYLKNYGINTIDGKGEGVSTGYWDKPQIGTINIEGREVPYHSEEELKIYLPYKPTKIGSSKNYSVSRFESPLYWEGDKVIDKNTKKPLFQDGGDLKNYNIPRVDYDRDNAPKDGTFLLPDLNRPNYKDEQGQYRSEYKMGINDGINEVNIPTVINGEQLTPDGAITRYKETGLHMGKYDTIQEANIAAQKRTAKYNFLTQDPVKEQNTKIELQQGGEPILNWFQKGGETIWDTVNKQFAEGGETKIALNIYKDYVNGIYDDTPAENHARKVYDRLNTIHLHKAKQGGVSPTNYIMTNLISLK